MSNAPTTRDGAKGTFRLDRREFTVAGLALAAISMFPRFGASAPTPPLVSARRKLGALEVSAIGLGCMSMNSGNYERRAGR